MEVQKSRSVIIKKFGGYESLLVEDINLPPLDGNIEIKVEYGGINFADLYTRVGLLREQKFPFVLGIECSGTITAIGTKETELKVGQKVICYDYKGGMYRDIVRVSPDKCFPLPEFVSTKIGAAIFVNYLTAYFALIEMGSLKEYERVLLLSCAGGVGWAVTQIAKTVTGVQIFGTGTRAKSAEANRNGIDTFFPHEDFHREIQHHKFDVIIANEAGNTFTFLQTLLNPLGRIVLIGANNLVQPDRKLSIYSLLKAWWTMKYISPESLIVHNRIVSGLHLGTLVEQDPEKVIHALNYIFGLLKIGKIEPRIDSTWPMSKIVDATKVLGERRNIGKVLIYMNETDDGERK